MSIRRAGEDVRDNRAFFEDEDEGFVADLEIDVAEAFGGSTDEATVARVLRGRSGGDWGPL